jgi:hypothetical protein
VLAVGAGAGACVDDDALGVGRPPDGDGLGVGGARDGDGEWLAVLDGDGLAGRVGVGE